MTRDEIARVLRDAGIDDADRLAALAERSLRITPLAAPPVAIGASRLGGVPDVPADFVWPTLGDERLPFLAQIDLAELAAPELPATGWLLFFHDSLCCRVIHLDVPRDMLLRRSDVGARALQFATGIDLPDFSDGRLEHEELEDRAYEAVALRLSGSPAEPYHHLLGNPQHLQDDMRGELPGAAEAWRLLLQLDVDGRLYFWIRHDELAARRFEDVFVIQQFG